MHFDWFLDTYHLLEDRHITDTTIYNILLCHHRKQIDSMLPLVCTVVDHNRRQNLVRTSVTYSAASRQ